MATDPRGPSDWPVWVALLGLLVIVVLAILILTGHGQQGPSQPALTPSPAPTASATHTTPSPRPTPKGICISFCGKP